MYLPDFNVYETKESVEYKSKEDYLKEMSGASNNNNATGLDPDLIMAKLEALQASIDGLITTVAALANQKGLQF